MKYLKNENGLSFTLLKDKAEWFAGRLKKDGYVIKRIIRKIDALAYLGGRNEEEIVLKPKWSFE